MLAKLQCYSAWVYILCLQDSKVDMFPFFRMEGLELLVQSLLLEPESLSHRFNREDNRALDKVQHKTVCLRKGS